MKAPPSSRSGWTRPDPRADRFRAPAANPAGAATVGWPDAGRELRLLGQHVSPELLALWVVEVLVCMALLYGLLAAAPGGAPPGPRLQAANQAAALALTFGLTSVAVGLYSPEVYLRTRRLLADSAIGALLGLSAVWLVGRVVGIDIAGLSVGHPRLVLLGLAVWALLLCLLRLGFSYALRGNLFVRRVLVIGDGGEAAALAGAIAALRRGVFEVMTLPPDAAAAMLAGPAGGPPGGLGRSRLWGVVVADAARDTLAAGPFRRAGARGVRLYSHSAFWERELRRIPIGHGPLGEQVAAQGEPGRLETALHRFSDIVLSLTLLAFTLPLMLLTAVLVVLDSPGPLLYRQERVGLRGRPFTLLKFRSMRADAEARGPVWAMRDDPRVTRVGAFIRLTRIDELPQLCNVLRGEMSFIGPRPERPHFVTELERALPFYAVRARVKPGLTGWAQVNYPYGASVEDARAKLSYDLYYVRHRGLLLNLMILFATVRVVLFQRGAR